MSIKNYIKNYQGEDKFVAEKSPLKKKILEDIALEISTFDSESVGYFDDVKRLIPDWEMPLYIKGRKEFFIWTLATKIEDYNKDLIDAGEEGDLDISEFEPLIWELE